MPACGLRYNYWALFVQHVGSLLPRLIRRMQPSLPSSKPFDAVGQQLYIRCVHGHNGAVSVLVGALASVHRVVNVVGVGSGKPGPWKPQTLNPKP